ncbi:MAG: hypothetical protein K6B72_02640 [Lachnospiraceae bacterium]|nr:hypothetical protein [Lachnospiraceae bacterium]
MSVTLSGMTPEEYEAFYQMSFSNHVEELIAEEHMSLEDARRESEDELSQMLPDGLRTENNYLMTIREAEEHIPVGYIWTLHEDCEGTRQSFLREMNYGRFMKKRIGKEDQQPCLW